MMMEKNHLKNKASISILLPPVWPGVFVSTARLLQHSLTDLGIEATIREATETSKGDLAILLGWNMMPVGFELSQPYILYQLEPLTFPMWQEKVEERITLFRKAVAVWDYAEPNMSYWKQRGFPAEVLPIGFHERMIELPDPDLPDFDVLFVGFVTERRKQILERLQRLCSVSVQPLWGRDFIQALGRSKLLLNIHQYDIPTPLEQPRISYALNNGAMVISEEGADNPYAKLVSCSYHGLIDNVMRYLYHPAERSAAKKEMADAFRQMRMTGLLQKALENVWKD
jgi:hypothetical protein